MADISVITLITGQQVVGIDHGWSAEQREFILEKPIVIMAQQTPQGVSIGLVPYGFPALSPKGDKPYLTVNFQRSAIQSIVRRIQEDHHQADLVKNYRESISSIVLAQSSIIRG